MTVSRRGRVQRGRYTIPRHPAQPLRPAPKGYFTNGPSRDLAEVARVGSRGCILASGTGGPGRVSSSAHPLGGFICWSRLAKNSRAAEGRAPSSLTAAAMVGLPAHPSSDIAALRSTAKNSGAWPLWIGQLSSPKVTSRTQCRQFSICQCTRHRFSNSAASARWPSRLVML